MSSWWSRKSSKHPHPTIHTSTASLSPIHHEYPRSAITPATTSSGLLDPYHYAQTQRKESAPARLYYDLSPPPSASGTIDSHTVGSSSGRNNASARPRTAESRSGPPSASGSLSLSGIFGRGSGNSSSSKRPSTAGGVAIDTSSPYVSNRGRAYSSASTATSAATNFLMPVTPVEWTDDYSSLSPGSGGRGRSNSASSQPSSMLSAKRRQHQPPSLLAVEEYDPFAAGNTTSIILPTPPALTPEGPSFYAQQPDANMLRQRTASEGYREPLPRAYQPPMLKIPTFPPPIKDGRLASPVGGPSKPGPSSAGPFSKKQILPFRTKSTKEKKRFDDADSLKGESSHSAGGLLGGFLRPNHTNRLSAHSSESNSHSSDGSRNNSLREPSHQRSRVLSNTSDRPTAPTSRLPTISPATIHRPLRPPQITPPPPPSSDLSSVTATTRSTVTSPATSPSQAGHEARSRPISADSTASTESSRRRKRVQAALALSLPQDGAKDGGGNNVINIHVDVDLLSPGGREATPRRGSGKSSKVSPVSGEDGTFEFLLPPKPFKPSTVQSPQYGAPSFIAESVMSPGDQFYFASPYPSGVTQVPVFPQEWADEENDGEDGGAKPEVSLSSGPATPIPREMKEALEALDRISPLVSTPSPTPTPPPPTRAIPPPPPPPTLDIPPSPAPPPSTRATKPLQIPGKTYTVPTPSPSPSPISPVYFRPNPLLKNADANLSTLSFSSVSSKGVRGKSRSRSRSRPARGEDDGGDSDIDVDVKSLGRRKRRGSEPTSPKARMFGSAGSVTSVMSSAFGGGSAMPSTPPSSFPASKIRQQDIPSSPPTPRQSRSHSTSSSTLRGRMPMYQFVANMGSPCVSEEAGPSQDGASPPTAPVADPSVKRRKSFNHPALPPIPSIPLRHYNSFTPVLSPAPESAALSSTSASKPEALPKRTLHRRPSKASLASKTDAVGPKGESLEFEAPDWAKESKRYPPEDDSRSLKTLNRGSIDELGSSPPLPTMSSPPRHVRSPTRTDFTPMHILPPSELLRLGDASADDDDSGGSDDDLMAVIGPRTDHDDLLHGDFDDMGSTLRDPEGTNWLLDLGLHNSPAARLTSPMMPIYKGRELPSSASSSIRGLTRPSTGGGGRRDSIVSSKSKASTITTRRPSTATNTPLHARSPLMGGGPLSPPPPPRSRLPRSSISSSMRSVPGVVPLAPPPSRSRANSHNDGLSLIGTSSPLMRKGAELSPFVENANDKVYSLPLKDLHTLTQLEKRMKRKESLLGSSTARNNRTSMKNKRQSLKPSFLDIDFEVDDEEDDDFAPIGGGGRMAQVLEDSFLDLGRGPSMDSVRES